MHRAAPSSFVPRRPETQPEPRPGHQPDSPTDGGASRREFLRTSLAAAATVAAAGPLAHGARRGAEPSASATTAPEKDKAPANKDARTLLILGGTAFLGPEVVDAAKAKGWTITLFNRGKTRPNLFPDLEKLRGDRDPKKDEGLKALEGRSWDYVVDTSGYFPRMVKASAELLAPKVKKYLFVSTVSVYARNDQPNQDESGEIGVMADPTVEDMGAQSENYGPLKALCEQAATKAMNDAGKVGNAINVRPGYIVGPGDWSGRFNYWPLRIRSAAKGEKVLAPGTPGDPLQVVDVRDLADFIVHALEADLGTDIEKNRTFNVLGPSASDKPTKWGDVLEACKRVSKSECALEWVNSEFLSTQAGPMDYLPIWLPPTGETSGFHQRSNLRAVKAGLKFRTMDDTIAAFFKWYDALSEDRQKRFVTGISRERESEILKAWAEKK